MGPWLTFWSTPTSLSTTCAVLGNSMLPVTDCTTRSSPELSSSPAILLPTWWARCWLRFGRFPSTVRWRNELGESDERAVSAFLTLSSQQPPSSTSLAWLHGIKPTTRRYEISAFGTCRSSTPRCRSVAGSDICGMAAESLIGAELVESGQRLTGVNRLVVSPFLVTGLVAACGVDPGDATGPHS